MSTTLIHTGIKTAEFSSEALNKGTWISILHARRIPPHAGLMFDGNYNSLTIKDHELNIDSQLLLKTIQQRKIKSIFLKIIPHPVFSLTHQLEIFQEDLKHYGFVKENENTCLTPIKNFFRDFYAMHSTTNDLLFEFVTKLNKNHFVEYATTLHLETEKNISLPSYTLAELAERIKTERQPYYNN